MTRFPYQSGRTTIGLQHQNLLNAIQEEKL